MSRTSRGVMVGLVLALVPHHYALAAAPGKRKADAPAAQKVSDADLRAVMRAKSTFIFSTEQCQQKSTCETSLLNETESAFVVACQKCATDERCESERQAIRDGKAKSYINPCL